MLGIVLNERVVVEKGLNGIGHENKSVFIKIMIKYYYMQGVMDKKDLLICINDVLEKCYDDIDVGRWQGTILRHINSFFKYVDNATCDLVNIDKIDITKAELDVISSLNDKKKKKIAFILLIYAKISNIYLNRVDGWVYQPIQNIFTEAKVSLSSHKKYMLLHELYKDGLIDVTKKANSTNIKVEFINEESPVGISLSQDMLSHAIYCYLNYIGENWKLCSCCDEVWVRKKKNCNKKTYCTKCSKSVKIHGNLVKK